ncbi:MAG: diphosphomevalonate decarboxylase [Breznakibacter sp.]
MTTAPQGHVTWQSPSNIAIVKYWGKKAQQIPMNPSLSMTLSRSVTHTSVTYRPKQAGETLYSFSFHQKAKESFSPKLESFFGHVLDKYPQLGHYHFEVQSSNSFPHSAGIASSASAMSALALCIEEIALALAGTRSTFSPIGASELSRLGSGSAVRSLHPQWAVWGKTDALPGSDDHFASPLVKVDNVFTDFCDTILIVDSSQKDVSSTAGHRLMDNHPYKEGRLQQAHRHIRLAIDAIGTGNLPLFIEVCEEEALSLHALMMSSHPGYLLMKPATLQIMDKVRRFRDRTGIAVAFTLDAGPNVHLLYPRAQRHDVLEWIHAELLPLCENNRWIDDHMGHGPTKTR